MSDLEREVRKAIRRYATRAQALDEATAERDEAIRKALAAKVPRARLAELTGLSVPRLDQIRRGTR